MAGGPILPSSIYVGGASGNLSPTFYVPATNTNTAGAIEGIGVIASLGSDAPAVLQFNLPESTLTGTALALGPPYAPFTPRWPEYWLSGALAQTAGYPTNWTITVTI